MLYPKKRERMIGRRERREGEEGEEGEEVETRGGGGDDRGGREEGVVRRLSDG